MTWYLTVCVYLQWIWSPISINMVNIKCIFLLLIQYPLWTKGVTIGWEALYLLIVWYIHNYTYIIQKGLLRPYSNWNCMLVERSSIESKLCFIHIYIYTLAYWGPTRHIYRTIFCQIWTEVVSQLRGSPLRAVFLYVSLCGGILIFSSLKNAK